MAGVEPALLSELDFESSTSASSITSASELSIPKIEKKINDLSESLENYGIKIIDGKITDLN